MAPDSPPPAPVRGALRGERAQPRVWHALGAVYLRAGRAADAERVYREDLARFPENGWSLFGVGRALRLQKKDAEAEAVEARFEKAWSRADVKIGSTCLCQPGV